MPTHLQILRNVTLKKFNTFGIEAHACYFVVIQTLQALKELLAMEAIQKLPKLILGEGSNVLFTQDYPGVVIKNDIKGITLLKEDDNHIWIQVGAGEIWHDFVLYCIQHGYAGIENLSLIPGTVGAAPIQNIGAYGVELNDVFFQLAALNLKEGTIHQFDRQACQFSYRDSIFKGMLKNQFVILSVVLQLNKKPQFHIDYGNVKDTLRNMQIDALSIKAISDAVIHIRQNKLPDPKKLGNAGSFFKNPIISYAHFLNLQKSFPAIPHFFMKESNGVKVNAAWLIEQCGWKGKRFGDIGVYEKQALILVNYGKGNAFEIQALAEKIKTSVYEQFGILLSPEVNYI